MVRLTKIYTRGGDKGETSLGSGARVPKFDLRVEVFVHRRAQVVLEAWIQIGQPGHDEACLFASKPRTCS